MWLPFLAALALALYSSLRLTALFGFAPTQQKTALRCFAWIYMWCTRRPGTSGMLSATPSRATMQAVVDIAAPVDGMPSTRTGTSPGTTLGPGTFSSWTSTLSSHRAWTTTLIPWYENRLLAGGSRLLCDTSPLAGVGWAYTACSMPLVLP